MNIKNCDHHIKDDSLCITWKENIDIHVAVSMFKLKNYSIRVIISIFMYHSFMLAILNLITKLSWIQCQLVYSVGFNS